jgi:hypothetical protein
LVDHFGGIEEHVLLVVECLDDEGEEFADGVVSRLKEFGVDHKADNLFDQAVDNAIPSVLGKASLYNFGLTMSSSKI